MIDLGYKLFLGRDGGNRQREAAIHLRLQTALVRRVTQQLGNEIDRTAREAANAVSHGMGRLGISIATHHHAQHLAAIMTPHYRVTLDTFGRRLIDGGKSLGRKDDVSDFTLRVNDWLRIWGSQRVVDISQTTVDRINGALAAGEAAGESLGTIANRIVDDTGGLIARARADVIARTETHTAANAANDLALDAMGLSDLEREWIAVEDRRTRPSHAAADGQRRRQGEPFHVGKALLDYPGDPDGPPEEIINCRCVLATVAP